MLANITKDQFLSYLKVLVIRVLEDFFVFEKSKNECLSEVFLRFNTLFCSNQ
jgi:hypothetical protein